MKESETRKLMFDLSFLPVGWSVIPDPENPERFLAFPEWLMKKLKTGEYISEKDFTRYQDECSDLEIDYFLYNLYQQENKTKKS